MTTLVCVPPTRREWAALGRISASIALTETAVWMSLPLITLGLASAGHSPLTIGLVTALPAAAVIALTPILPTLVRIAGAAPLFHLASLLLVATSMLLVSLAGSQSPLFWGLAAMLVGTSSVIRWIIGDGTINRMADGPYRGRILSVHETIRSSAIGIGPAIVALTGGDVAIGFSIAAVLGLLGLLGALGSRFHGVESPRTGGWALIRAVRASPAMVALAFLGGLLESAAATSLPLYGVAAGLGAGAAAALASASGFGNLFGQIPFGWAADRFGSRRPAAVALMMLGLGLGVLPLAAAFGSIGFTVLLAFGAGAGALYTLAVMRANEAASGAGILATIGAIAVCYTLGALSGPIVGGLALSLDPHWGLSGTLMAITAVLATIILARR